MLSNLIYRPQDGTWIEVASTSINHSYLTIRGVNIAGFIGSLFNVKMISAEDVFLCLFLLLGGEKHFDRLCAIHALLIQANDKLCKSRNLPNLAEFKARLIERDPVSGLYRRASESPALTILQVTAALHRKIVVSTDFGLCIHRIFSTPLMDGWAFRRQSANDTRRL